MRSGDKTFYRFLNRGPGNCWQEPRCHQWLLHQLRSYRCQPEREYLIITRLRRITVRLSQSQRQLWRPHQRCTINCDGMPWTWTKWGTMWMCGNRRFDRHFWVRQRQVRMPSGSWVSWAECLLIMATGCRVFSLILDSSFGLSAGIQSAGDWVSETFCDRIRHSAEEENLSPFDSKIGHSVCWGLGFRDPLVSNPAFSRGRQLACATASKLTTTNMCCCEQLLNDGYVVFIPPKHQSNPLVSAKLVRLSKPYVVL